MGARRALCAAAVAVVAACRCTQAGADGEVIGVWPPTGSAAGGTPVTLFGDAFFDEEDAVCVFGAASASAALASPFRAACVSPPGALGFVSVHLSFNGGVDVGDELNAEFMYTGERARRRTQHTQHRADTFASRPPELADVRSLAPVAGDTGGGAVVWLVGAHFAAATACAWGVAAGGDASAFVSSALLRCEAPPLPPGATIVRAALYAESSDAGATFTAHPAMLSATATPAVAHASGGTHVVLAGDQFRDGEDARCAFGSLLVAAAVTGTARASCVAPAHAPGRTRLSLAMHAVTDAGAVDFLFAGAHACADALCACANCHAHLQARRWWTQQRTLSPATRSRRSSGATA
jgi:hypothetical protein